jgi:hypothetical protein
MTKVTLDALNAPQPTRGRRCGNARSMPQTLSAGEVRETCMLKGSLVSPAGHSGIAG